MQHHAGRVDHAPQRRLLGHGRPRRPDAAMPTPALTTARRSAPARTRSTISRTAAVTKRARCALEQWRERGVAQAACALRGVARRLSVTVVIPRRHAAASAAAAAAAPATAGASRSSPARRRRRRVAGGGGFGSVRSSVSVPRAVLRRALRSPRRAHSCARPARADAGVPRRSRSRVRAGSASAAERAWSCRGQASPPVRRRGRSSRGAPVRGAPASRYSCPRCAMESLRIRASRVTAAPRARSTA